MLAPSPRVAQVVQLLCAACSADSGLRTPALQRLQELESQPGFVELLLEAYADSSVDCQSRLLSVLTCKAVVERQWQPRGDKSMSIEEKTAIKEQCLRLLRAAIDGALPYLLELTLVLRRICRFEFPKQWDSLAHFLLSELQSFRLKGFTESAVSAVLVLHNVLKEQTSKRLMSSRRDTHQVGQLFIEPLGALWSLKSEHLRTLLANQGVEAIAVDRLWKLSRHLDGCFLVLLAQGFPHLHEVPSGANMIQLVKEHVDFLLMLLHSSSDRLVSCQFFLKDLKSVLKWWAKLLQLHPLAFAQANVCSVLHNNVEVLRTCSSLKVSQHLRPWSEGLLISSLQMITHGLHTAAFRKGPTPAHQGALFELVAVCHQQFADFLRTHGVGELCELACQIALQLSVEEVMEWLSDPEDQLLGPKSQTALHSSGEAFIRALGEAPLDRPLVEHIAQRTNEQLSRPPTKSDTFDMVCRTDTLLSVLALCQSQLKPHLQFEGLMGLLSPIAALVSQITNESFCTLLPVRLCWVIKCWVAEISTESVAPVLQLLQGFLHISSPKAVRLAALSPLRSMLERFSDNDAWAQMQSGLIDACLSLLTEIKLPEVQWRCLNLIHLFLCEEAESGRYAVTERTLQQLLALWRQPEQGELLIRHAILDVLRALVLMSDRTRKSRLPLSAPLLSCCLAVISDCYAQQRGAVLSPAGPEVSAALKADAYSAAEQLGDRASAIATLFDSSGALFLGVLRTVELDQAAPLIGFFPQLLSQHTETSGPLPEWTLDILLEYCSMYSAAPAGSMSHLGEHYPALVRICQRRLQQTTRDRTIDLSLQLLQLLLAQAPSQEALQQCSQVASELLQLWATSFDPWATRIAFPYPVQPMLGLLGAWAARHPAHFSTQVAAQGDAGRVALLLAASCRHVRPVDVRASILQAALTVTKVVAIDEAFWREFMQSCDDLTTATQKSDSFSSSLVLALQVLKSSLSAKLPSPSRSALELQFCLVPSELRLQAQSVLKDDGSLQETSVAHWLFGRIVAWLHERGSSESQALLAAAPEQVRAALASSGL